ncbi:MAG: hypothetical protein ABWZ82_01795 [Candidatus Limnocylindrales bacterium]
MALLEVAARVIRRHAIPLLAVAVLFQLPSSLVDAAAQQHLGHALAPVLVGLDDDAPRVLTPTPEQARSILEALLLLAGSSIVGTLLGAIATLAFTAAVLADYHGRRPTVGGMIRTALGRALPALGAALLASLALLGVIAGAVALAAGALTFLPSPDGNVGGLGAFLAILVAVAAAVTAVVVIVRLALHAAVLAGEPGGAIQALRRSWHLTADNTWRSFAVLATVAILMTIIGSTILELVAVVVTVGIAAGMGLADASDALIAALVSTLLAPVGGVVLGVLYLDLRVRRDGWQPVIVEEGAAAA